jgi:ribosomal protein S18 acetylase RimI-like enzyme
MTDSLDTIHKQCFNEDIIMLFPNTDIIPLIIDGKIIAYLALRKLEKNHYHIYNVCTGINDRNKGHMTRLLIKVLNDIKINKSKHEDYPIQEHNIKITLEVDNKSNAIRLYLRLGFIIISENNNKVMMLLEI